MNGRKGSRIRALVAMAAVVIVLEVQPAEARPPARFVAKSSTNPADRTVDPRLSVHDLIGASSVTT